MNQGCVQCLCDLMNQYDANTLEAVLEGLENVLRVGENIKKNSTRKTNIYAERLKEQIGSSLLNLRIAEPPSVLHKIQNIITKIGLYNSI